MIYFTSDLHFGHNQPFIYQARGYNSMEEHDKDLIKRWNEKITPDDTIYILGDIMLGDNEYGLHCFCQLPGHIIIIRGNHETNKRWKVYQKGLNVDSVELIGWSDFHKFVAYKHGAPHQYNMYLSHYPTMTYNSDENLPLNRRVINLCGHLHTKYRFKDFSRSNLCYHVELDAHDMTPVSIEEVVSDIEGALIR